MQLFSIVFRLVLHLKIIKVNTICIKQYLTKLYLTLALELKEAPTEIESDGQALTPHADLHFCQNRVGPVLTRTACSLPPSSVK